jgi:hypothetical protein
VICACSLCALRAAGLPIPKADPMQYITPPPAVTLADRLRRLGVTTASEAIDLLEQRLSAATGQLDNRAGTV